MILTNGETCTNPSRRYPVTFHLVRLSLDGEMLSMYVSESWIINLLVLYLLQSISILICDFWHRSRADIDLIPHYVRHPTFGYVIFALFFGPLSLFVQLAGRIRRRSGEALISAWEVYYTVAIYGVCFYDPKWTYFILLSAAHFYVRRIARYTRDLPNEG